MTRKPSVKCAVKFCRRKRAEGRTICHKHKSRKWREQQPISSLFHRCKGHAKERGILWLLTMEEFKEFCERTGYHLTKGQYANFATIDRIRGTEPYQADNIQVLTKRENTLKAHLDGARMHLYNAA